MKWQVHKAKSHFSELLRQAEEEGPQIITRHGTDKIVVLSIEAYQKLEDAQPNFKDYLLSGPKVDDFVVDRLDDTGRDIQF